ncbi:MAG TPA: hypothetical protein VIL36_18895 [Acidimicrobiales bacterium]
MSTVFDLLEREWCSLARDTGAARRLADVCRVAGGAATLADVVAYVRGADAETADRVLVALVRRAVTGDALAARVLLQLLLPGTRNLARRWWALGDPDERAAAAVAAVYHRICHYPLERRPAKVAVNVLMDAARELRRSVARASTAVCTPAAEPPEDRRDREPPVHAARELAEVLVDAVADGRISAADARLIAESRIAGTRVESLAARQGVSTRTLWARRQRAEAALARTRTRARTA